MPHPPGVYPTSISRDVSDQAFPAFNFPHAQRSRRVIVRESGEGLGTRLVSHNMYIEATGNAGGRHRKYAVNYMTSLPGSQREPAQLLYRQTRKQRKAVAATSGLVRPGSRRGQFLQEVGVVSHLAGAPRRKRMGCHLSQNCLIPYTYKSSLRFINMA